MHRYVYYLQVPKECIPAFPWACETNVANELFGTPLYSIEQVDV